MTGHDDFDRTLADWFEVDAHRPRPPIASSVSSPPLAGAGPGRGGSPVSAATGSGRRTLCGSSSGVGEIPRLGLRWSTALVLLLVIAALLGAAIMVGAVCSAAPLATGRLGNLAYGLDGDVYVADWDGRNPRRIADGLPVLEVRARAAPSSGGIDVVARRAASRVSIGPRWRPLPRKRRM